MLKNDFNQPKGSTIGVLRDGRTVQEAVGVRMQLDCSMQVAGEVTTIHSWMIEVHS